MKLLYLCQRIPFPPDRGDRIAVYHQIRYLREKGHAVVVGSLIHAGTRENVQALAGKLSVKVIALGHSKWRQVVGMAAAFSQGKPLSLGYFQNSRLAKAFETELAKNVFDAIIIFSSSMAQYVENFRHAPRIMNFCDVDSRKWASLAQKAHGPKRWVYLYESRTLLEYERKIAATFDSSCVVSSNEADLFRKHIPGIPVHVLENGVDVDYFSAVPRKGDGVNIVFTGVMDYPPNVEAVSFFVHDVWSRIHQAHPQARFVIVGSNPVKSVRDLSRVPGVEVTGYVPDVRPYLAMATVSVAPLAVARGVQNKILEAMAAGAPVLTTPDVANGLPAGAQSLVSRASREAEMFADALLNLVENKTSREEQSKKAQEFVRKNCSWEVKLQTLDKLLAQVIQ